MDKTQGVKRIHQFFFLTGYPFSYKFKLILWMELQKLVMVAYTFEQATKYRRPSVNVPALPQGLYRCF